ncbi:ricin-type beta-trefoil lectin domain protein [Streptomyces sp. NPDC044984]|uniref:RICIN domain-containing protein n=1 Tax=Streptomyces sp. NPDC044984 TaxID=3154335 RepID=UPI0033F720CA
MPRGEGTEPVAPSGTAPQSATGPAGSAAPSARTPAEPSAGSSVSSAPSARASTSFSPTAVRAPDTEGPASPTAASTGETDGDPLISGASGTCLTRTATLTVAACDGASTQRWSLSGRTLRSGDQCAQVPAGTVSGRTPLTTAPCDGSTSQLFRLSGQALVAVVPGLCLDLFGGAAGSEVVFWECNGRDNQTWESG